MDDMVSSKEFSNKIASALPRLQLSYELQDKTIKPCLFKQVKMVMTAERGYRT